MSEEEWLTSIHLEAMFGFIRGRISSRKLRLFGCGCCRRVWHLLADPRSQRAVETAERYADGEVSKQWMSAAQAEADRAVPARDWGSITLLPEEQRNTACASLAAKEVARAADRGAVIAEAVRQAANWAFTAERLGQVNNLETVIFQCNVLRCAVGNPFRLVVPSTSWRTSTALALARTIYTDRAFDRLPVLADALEEAGCDNADVLTHCRGDGPHVRGCWVVDLILGKE